MHAMSATATCGTSPSTGGVCRSSDATIGRTSAADDEDSSTA